MENSIKIMAAIRTALNSEKLQAMFGDTFEMMDEETKVNFMTMCFFETVKSNQELMNIVALDTYNALRAE